MAHAFRAFFVAALFLSATSSAHAADTIALVQYNADKHFGDYDTNQANLTAIAEEAVAAGASIIVFPEGSLHGYATASRLWCKPGMTRFSTRECSDVSTVAESAEDGNSVQYWQNFAKTYDVTVIINLIEVAAGRYYNTSVAVSGDAVLGTYRKQRLYYIDQAYAQPGTSPTVIEINDVRFGMLICMDLNYDSLFQVYRTQGITNIIAPMNWDQAPVGQRSGKVFFRSQARRNSMNLLVSDQSPWDSTGFYPKTGEGRLRAPLESDAVDHDGFTLVSVSAL